MMIRKHSRKIGSSATKKKLHHSGRIYRQALYPMRRATYTIPGYGVVLGCLWRVETHEGDGEGCGYAVSLEGLGTSGFGMLGRDPKNANLIFLQLVRNTVTPCTLQDVLDELL